MGGDMVADYRRSIDAGEQRRLSCGALGQAGYTQTSIEGTQGQVSARHHLVPHPAVEDQRSAQQIPQTGHGHLAQRIVRPRWSQSYPVEKDKKDPGPVPFALVANATHSL